MNEITHDTVGLLRRELRDTRTLASNIDHRLRKLLDGPAQIARPAGIVARLAFVSVAGMVEKRGREHVALQLFKTDTDLHRLIELRAATGPARTDTAGWAAELVGETVGDLLLNILPDTALSQLRARSAASFVFDGPPVRIPGHTPAASGGFVSQGGPVPLARLVLTSLTLPMKKAATITAFSKELANGSPQNVERAFRLLLQGDLGLAVDAVLLDANAADATRPAGLLNGLTALPPTATGTPSERVMGDVKALLAAISPAASPVLIVNAVQGASLDVLAPGLPKIVSVANAAGVVIACDAAAFTSGLGAPDFDTSENPLIVESDAPSQIGTPGSPNTVAAPSRSLWQTATIGLRAILDCNWAMRRAGAVAYMTGVSW